MSITSFHKIMRKLAATLAVAGAVTLIPLAVHAAAAVATMTNHGSAISWHPSGTYKSASLTVSGPDGSVTQQDFSRQEQISISAPGADGLYTYELVLTPKIPPGLRAKMNDHRANHPGKKFMGGLKGGTQSGTFRVSGGSVLNSAQAE